VNASGPSTATQSSPIANAQQSLYNASGQNGAQVTQDTYHGSVVTGKATGEVLDLSLDDAIQRGPRHNLRLILQTPAVKNANGQRREELQSLLPTVNATTSIEVQQINLAAFGIKAPGLNPIVGPFQIVDFRAFLTTNLVNVSALKNYIAAKHNFEGAKLTAEDARDLVVLTVGNAYLLCIADAARIEAVTSQLATSKISLDQAVANHDAGTSPRLDVLRAQVDYQNQQQSLISAKNSLEKDKLALARTIGLPLDQVFRLTDLVPFKPLDNVDPQAAFIQALKSRKDLAAYAEQVKSTSAEKSAAKSSRSPKPKDRSRSPTPSTNRPKPGSPTRSSRSIRTCATACSTSRLRQNSSTRPARTWNSPTRPSATRSSAIAPVSPTTCPSPRRKRRSNRPTINTSARSISTMWPSFRWPAPSAPRTNYKVYLGGK
jgi:outer membrane protein TolC